MNKSILNISFVLLTLLYCMDVQAQGFYFEESQPLSDTLNSDAEESLPIYSEQDSTLFFVRSLYAQNTGGIFAGQDIWYTKKDTAGQWIEPRNDLSALNNEGNNAIVGISSSGSTLYLLNDYGTEASQQAGLSLSFKQDQRWRTPNKITIPGLTSKQGNFYSLYVLPTEDVALISVQLENSIGQEDLYVSIKDPLDNQWTEPIHLGPTINTEGFEISPYLTADKKTLFFSSNGHPGYGNADIFVSQRLDTSWTNWTRPENLGDQINSTGFDAYFTANKKNEVFFVSNRGGSSANMYTSQMFTDEERQRQLAQRVQGGGRGAEMLSQDTSGLNGMDTETQALLDETRALLDEFNRMKTGGSNNDDPSSTSSSGNEFTPQEMLFQLNSAEIQNNYNTSLNEVVETLQQNPRLKVEIVGHADDTGGKDYNLKLSIDRAIEVKRFLIENGVGERRIITYGKGATEPVANAQTPEARQKNRRVVITFL
ncbi:OmpA family protein [Catalinimonas niigatensis]|uniref:OmpA family protein n=1 Tax=Catalinimonas niigatensis TaxID=1397264 RepID=UPI00266692CB|nr:OmpA family protein [Catalinimonas niigatensis]WPP50130.1 OmpA family protein [Catalinimonas niigatensis]